MTLERVVSSSFWFSNPETQTLNFEFSNPQTQTLNRGSGTKTRPRIRPQVSSFSITFLFVDVWNRFLFCYFTFLGIELNDMNPYSQAVRQSVNSSFSLFVSPSFGTSYTPQFVRPSIRIRNTFLNRPRVLGLFKYKKIFRYKSIAHFFIKVCKEV